MTKPISPALDPRTVLVTGGAGFIGSNLLLRLVPRHPTRQFVNADLLTYAGHLENLEALAEAPNYRFVKVDLGDFAELSSCFGEFAFDAVIHLAAETHVDRSIVGPAPFVRSNILGTFHLLELARARLETGHPIRFHHVSSDEVYGSAQGDALFDERAPYRPGSPYAASKAAADHLVDAYRHTYGLDTVVTNSCNNYGPYQYPEKLVPLVIRHARAGRAIPVYGDGRQVRDWLYVEDHCAALELALFRGGTGSRYHISARCEMTNIDLVRSICRLVDEAAGTSGSERLIRFVADRPGHDRRYAVSPERIRADLGWRPEVDLEEGLRRTVAWYLEHTEWLERCAGGSYHEYYAAAGLARERAP